MSKYAIAISPTGEQKLVNAFGEEVPYKDADNLTLLIVPELYLPGKYIETEELDLCEIRLFFRCPELYILNKGGFTLRQPYPNADYIVAGAVDSVMGWSIDLPSDIEGLTFTYDWRFSKDSVIDRETGVFRLLHQIEIKLEKTDRGHVFSTKLPFFENDKNKLTSVIFEENFKKFVGSNNVEKHSFSKNQLKLNPIYELNRECYQVQLYNSVKLNSCALSDLAFLLEFNDTIPFRERPQEATFKTGLKEHYAATSCSIPPSVFVKVVELARSIPFEVDNEYYEGAESHPAIKLLSDWWNNNAPQNRVAASMMPWVRVTEKHLYLSGYWEDPNELELDLFSPASTASCGDSILIAFLKSRTTAYYDKNRRTILEDVGGEIYETSGFDLEEYFPAWYSLHALADFPKRFPAAWTALKSLDIR